MVTNTQLPRKDAFVPSGNPVDLPQLQEDLLQRKISAVEGIASSSIGELTAVAPPSEVWKPDTTLAEAVHLAGFLYDPVQDIIFSTMNNFQRQLGYCKMYDETAIGISSVIDSEPVYFIDGNYEWMIELWKGQYGLETGCEIGIYRRELKTSITPFEEKNGKLYECASDAECLVMSSGLYEKKSPLTLFKRGPEKHWWLTGFKWGMFHEPEHLSMNATIRFETVSMMTAFKKALEKMKYHPACDSVKNEISFTFSDPASEQPKARKLAGGLIQKNNMRLVTQYNNLKTKLHIQSNDPNELDNAIRERGSKVEKDIFELLIAYFRKRRKTG
jgi:hypothetical protein